MKKTLSAVFMSFALGACAYNTNDTTGDNGIDASAEILKDRYVGIWVDPNGCDHWMIDDGVEGYMSPRVRPNGQPVCREGAVPGTSNVVRTMGAKNTF